MVASAIVALLPARWTACSGGLVQPLGWLSWAVTGGTREAEEAVSAALEPAASPDEVREMRRQLGELERKVGQQAVELAEMERLVADLSGLRDQLADQRAKIIFATVIGGDASPERETLTISKGARNGVRVGDWVAAGSPVDERDPHETGRGLLMRQWIIGRVSVVHPYLCHVQLTVDPAFGTERAWPAKALPDGSWETADTQCGLQGLGGGRMRIRQAPRDFRAEGFDHVLVPLAHPRPMALVAGRVVASEKLETGLHYDLAVEPWADPHALSHVYVVSFGP
jgi:cell shape-determining protein MreC